MTHEPVMADEVAALLQPRADGTYVDCTVGLGGHAEMLLARGAGRVIGLDRDSSALAHARTRLAPFGDRVVLLHADYRSLPQVLAAQSVVLIDGALADIGVSSMQVDDGARGFSFRREGALDMRMDQTSGLTLGERLATVDEATLAEVIAEFGEERHARRVAHAIVTAQAHRPIAGTTELASIVRRAAGRGGWERIDPATRTFQALRIWVNDELTDLGTFITTAVGCLKAAGRLVLIAFHSLEDRIVKRTFLQVAREGVGRIVTKKPLVPGDDECRRNPRARSAKLRAMERAA